MNEINVSIPYSLFKDIFTLAFSFRLIPSVSDDSACLSIDKAKKYWILLDSETRSDLIWVCLTYLDKGGDSEDVKEFINWASENINVEHRNNLQRPLVDILPVVNMAKVNHKAGD